MLGDSDLLGPEPRAEAMFPLQGHPRVLLCLLRSVKVTIGLSCGIMHMNFREQESDDTLSIVANSDFLS